MANISSAIPKEIISWRGDLKRLSPHSIHNQDKVIHQPLLSFPATKRVTSSTTESLRLIEEEMECQTKILESEKNDLQHTFTMASNYIEESSLRSMYRPISTYIYSPTLAAAYIRDPKAVLKTTSYEIKTEKSNAMG